MRKLPLWVKGLSHRTSDLEKTWSDKYVLSEQESVKLPFDGGEVNLPTPGLPNMRSGRLGVVIREVYRFT